VSSWLGLAQPLEEEFAWLHCSQKILQIDKAKALGF